MSASGNPPSSPVQPRHFGDIDECPGFFYRCFRRFLHHIPFHDNHQEALTALGRSGTVIYALKDHSVLNTLILYSLALRTGIPRPDFAVGINMLLWRRLPGIFSTLRDSLQRTLTGETSSGEEAIRRLKDRIRQGKTVVLPLGGAEIFSAPDTEAALEAILEAAEDSPSPVYLVPMLVAYGRRRERERENLVNIFFGQTENTGCFRRLLAFLRHAGKIIVMPAGSLTVSAWPREATSAETSHRLRAELLGRIDEERRVIIGPFLKTRREMIGLTLQEPSLMRALDALAPAGSKGRSALEKDAKRYLDEIAADYSETLISIWRRFLQWLFNNIYDGVVVDRAGMMRIRDVSRKMPFVIIPCHRSHVDYLLLSYLFYEHHIQMPFVAAGINMAFGPFGYIFRKSGAFFIRRTFRGNALYAEVFTHYLRVLMKEGLPIEFFIEGGRSRTGKMVMPKFGLLSMLFAAYAEKAVPDLAVVPVYIGYDRVIEEKSYLQELGGVPKTSESTTDVLRSSKVLRKRYGSVYVNVGEPIFLREYLASSERPLPDMTVEERQGLYQRMGHEIVQAINRVSVVTPFALLSSGLLSSERRGISAAELWPVLDEFYEWLVRRDVRLAGSFSHRAKALADAVAMFLESGHISAPVGDAPTANGPETVYTLDDERRLYLEYYKNNALHHFLPICFVAAAMLASRESDIRLQGVMQEYVFFRQLFRHEFIFDERRGDAEEVNSVLAYLHERGVIGLRLEEGEAHLEIRGRGWAVLQPYAGLIRNYFESYWVVMRGCEELEEDPKNEKDWIKGLHKFGQAMFRQGEVRRAESLSQSNYANAVTFLRGEGVLATRVNLEGKEKKEHLAVVAERRNVLEALRHRLFPYL